MINIDAENGGKLKMAGSMAEVTAETIMILREIFKKNLELFPEPEIAVGILTNMLVKAITLEQNNIKDKEVILSKE